MTSSPDPFERAWQELEPAWHDEAAHRRFIAFCHFQGALAEAGRRYRGVRDGDPQRRAQAERQLEAVLATALASLEPTARPTPTGRTRLFWGACGVGLALSGYALLSVLRLFGR